MPCGCLSHLMHQLMYMLKQFKECKKQQKDLIIIMLLGFQRPMTHGILALLGTECVGTQEHQPKPSGLRYSEICPQLPLGSLLLLSSSKSPHSPWITRILCLLFLMPVPYPLKKKCCVIIQKIFC